MNDPDATLPGVRVITVEDLKMICPHTLLAQLGLFVEPLNAAMAEFEISENGAREIMFLAQVAHESGGFMFLHELWGPTEAQAGYDARADLGNTRPEAVALAQKHGSTPGKWWRGHGLLQTTGYDNHKQVGEVLGLDLLNYPYLLEAPINAARSAGHFWATRGCNELADKGDFLGVTKRINGGTNGYQDRVSYYARAQLVFV